MQVRLHGTGNPVRVVTFRSYDGWGIISTRQAKQNGVRMKTQIASLIIKEWGSSGHRLPEPFVLVGHSGPYVVEAHGAAPLLIDAEGVVLESGAVYTWCTGGCCERPRRWDSVDAAADFHGSYIVTAGAVREPGR